MDNSAGDSFTPPWWLRNPHWQTIWHWGVRRRPKVTTHRERLELPDGDFLDLDWTPGNSGPIVIILHGLEGSIRSKYARGILRIIAAMGWRGVLMHFRSCSEESNRLPRAYHAGETVDFNTLVNTLRQREPHTPLAAIGYSLGGNVLLKWLGEQGEQAALWAAVAVSVPFDLEDGIARLNRGFSRAYQYRLLRNLIKSTYAKSKSVPCPLDLSTLHQARNLRDYDNLVTAPLHGFTSADDYYRQSSSRQFLQHICIPTLIIHAADDPFMTPQSIPGAHELSDSITFELSQQGGHIGFVTGKYPWQAHYWLESRIPAYLTMQLKNSACEPILS